LRTVTLLVSWPLPEKRTGAPRPAFDFTLARSTRRRPSHSGAIAWLCARFGLERNPDWPLAAIAAQSAFSPGGEEAWIFADPVHLEPRPERMTVLPAEALALTELEANALVSDLDSHFFPGGRRVRAFQRTRWLVNAPAPIRLNTAALDLLEPDSAAPGMLSGPDAVPWNAFLTELQMLLHAHPVNAARAARGEPTVNSLHFWGGGVAPALAPIDHGFAGGDALATALARAAGLVIAATSGTLLASLAPRREASALVVPDAEDSDPIATLDREWLGPMLEALADKRIDRIVLVAGGADGLLEHTLRRSAFWLFWKRPHSPGTHA
jgi:hypothetical protein